MTLVKLPKAFELSVNVKKGHFPHLFNTTENTNYIGSLPAVQYYGIDSMTENDRKEFLTSIKSKRCFLRRTNWKCSFALQT